jgi:multisubunit Na+/H+ antiporter MnhF subunit
MSLQGPSLSPPPDTPPQQRSLWSRVFNRSIYSLIFGANLADKNVAASIVGIMLVATLCYAVAWKERYEFMPAIINVVFVVVGYYFGAKREVSDDPESR